MTKIKSSSISNAKLTKKIWGRVAGKQRCSGDQTNSTSYQPGCQWCWGCKLSATTQGYISEASYEEGLANYKTNYQVISISLMCSYSCIITENIPLVLVDYNNWCWACSLHDRYATPLPLKGFLSEEEGLAHYKTNFQF